MLFTRRDSWTGGNIDALMYFDTVDVNHANAVSRSLWSFPHLKGPYLCRNVEPEQQFPVPVPQMSTDGMEQLVGVYTHHDGTRSNFIHTTIVDEDGLWVYAGPTVGGLPAGWNVGAYPFEDGRPTTWLPALYDDLRVLVSYVSISAPIRAATYGWLTAMDCDRLLEAIVGRIPEDRWGPIDIWHDGRHSYYPATHFEAPMRAGV